MGEIDDRDRVSALSADSRARPGSSANVAPNVRTAYIVEDDAAAREMLMALLTTCGFSTHGFASAEDFLRHGAGQRPACAVVDVHLPGMSGLELQAKLPRGRSRLPVIVITGSGDVATARQALLAGAVDFLEKPVQPQELLDAVDAAVATDAQAIAQEGERQRMAEMIAELTPRELEVFQRITDGSISREVAVELGISPRTVENYRERVMKKLKARRTADLFRFRLATDPGGLPNR